MIRGPIPTIWSSEGLDAGWSLAHDVIARARPRAVQLHSWTPGRVADRVREVLPGVQIVCGFGIDGIAREAVKGRVAVQRAIDTFATLATRAKNCGASVIVWNAEAAWKRPPTSTEAATLHTVIREGLAASAMSGIEAWHTAYDHPSYHATYPWRSWLGEGSPIVRSLPQVYAAPGAAGVMASRGALLRRETRALASWASAIRAGWIAQDDPATSLREGVAWSPYYQMHSVPARDTISSAVQHDVAALWALPSRADRDGHAAFGALCELDRLGLWGSSAVADFQRSAGLVADGIAGPITLAALGVP